MALDVDTEILERLLKELLLDMLVLSGSFVMMAEEIELISCVCLPRKRISYIEFLNPPSSASHMKSFCSVRKMDSDVNFKDFVEASWVCRKSSNDFSANGKPILCRINIITVCSSWTYLPAAEKEWFAKKPLFFFILKILYGRLRERHAVRCIGWQKCVVIQMRYSKEVCDFFFDKAMHCRERQHTLRYVSIPATGLQAPSFKG